MLRALIGDVHVSSGWGLAKLCQCRLALSLRVGPVGRPVLQSRCKCLGLRPKLRFRLAVLRHRPLCPALRTIWTGYAPMSRSLCLRVDRPVGAQRRHGGRCRVPAGRPALDEAPMQTKLKPGAILPYSVLPQPQE